MTASGCDLSYYASNGQDRDRPALYFYERLARSFFRPGRVLDFGCGTGFFLRRLSRHFEADGLETSEAALAHTRLLLPTARLYSRLDEVGSGAYAGIASLHVLEHIEDQALEEVLKSWRRALCPGGRVLCVVPELHGKGHRLKGDNWIGFGDSSHVNLKGREEYKKLFGEHGFRVVQGGTDGLWHFPYRAGRPKVLDMLRYAPATALQFLCGRLILPEGGGESMILLLEADT